MNKIKLSLDFLQDTAKYDLCLQNEIERVYNASRATCFIGSKDTTKESFNEITKYTKNISNNLDFIKK